MGVAQGRLSLGFFWSILLMVSMPFVLAGSGFVYMRRLMRRAESERTGLDRSIGAGAGLMTSTNPPQILDTVVKG